jgi:WD40 repeat protein
MIDRIHKIQEYAGHAGSLYGIAIDVGGNRLFTAGDDGLVVQWQIATAQQDGIALMRSARAIYALLYIPEKNMLVAGTSDGMVYIMDTVLGKNIETYRADTQPVYGLHYDVASEQLVILHSQGAISLYSLQDFRVNATIVVANAHLRSLCTLPTAPQQLLIGTSENTILAFDIRARKTLHHWTAHENSVFALMAHPTGAYLLSGGRDAHLCVWDMQQNWAAIARIPAHNFTINDIAFAPNAALFATASRDKTIKIWDSQTFQLLKVIDHARNAGHTHSVNRLRFLPDGSLLSLGDDRRIIRWQIA